MPRAQGLGAFASRQVAESCLPRVAAAGQQAEMHFPCSPMVPGEVLRLTRMAKSEVGSGCSRRRGGRARGGGRVAGCGRGKNVDVVHWGREESQHGGGAQDGLWASTHVPEQQCG